nr:MAG TPA: hypothetical protein [Caudoviricetes sp.]
MTANCPFLALRITPYAILNLFIFQYIIFIREKIF